LLRARGQLQASASGRPISLPTMRTTITCWCSRICWPMGSCGSSRSNSARLQARRCAVEPNAV